MIFDFHPEAGDEFREAVDWYEGRSIFAGGRFVKAVKGAIEQIMQDPERYQTFGDGTHVFRLKTFPYRFYYTYEAEPDLIRIFAVMHEKRRPDYWRERLGN
ncbi:MAG TPA: type II toxin-antitoxin system RelE/ParE family toxin [Prosthecobacter sp.]